MKHLTVVVLSFVLAAPVLADPPDHAPAHGYRKKEGHRHHGYTGTEWEQDYGVAAGRCDTDTVLATVGAVGGAVIGNRTASPENRTMATIAGALLGAVLGNEIGKSIDAGDRACIGHSLEIGRTGQAVRWVNPRTRIAYVVTPVRDLSGGCRQFRYQEGNTKQLATMVACREKGAGDWVVRRG